MFSGRIFHMHVSHPFNLLSSIIKTSLKKVPYGSWCYLNNSCWGRVFGRKIGFSSNHTYFSYPWIVREALFYISFIQWLQIYVDSRPLSMLRGRRWNRTARFYLKRRCCAFTCYTLTLSIWTSNFSSLIFCPSSTLCTMEINLIQPGR